MSVFLPYCSLENSYISSYLTELIQGYNLSGWRYSVP